ncbi:hypothetical protein L7F22_066423 [Adiantum nelumboides]|nr:hypothetical protein [Adiantum nelumboides]
MAKSRSERWREESLMMLLVLLLWTPSCWAGPSEDLITALPGQPNVSFAQYAGYITIDAAAGRSFFYYFAEANEPSSQPLTLWLNGGTVLAFIDLGRKN